MMLTETIINFVQEIINFPDFKLSTFALQQQIQHLLFLVNITDCCSDLSNVIEEHKQLMVCIFASLSCQAQVQVKSQSQGSSQILKVKPGAWSFKLKYGNINTKTFSMIYEGHHCILLFYKKFLVLIFIM